MSTTAHVHYRPAQDITAVADTALTAGQAITPTGMTDTVITARPAAAGEHIIGIAARDTEAGQLAHIVRGHIGEAIATGTITAGSPLTTAADGALTTAGDGDPVIAVAVTDDSDGRVVVAL